MNKNMTHEYLNLKQKYEELLIEVSLLRQGKIQKGGTNMIGNSQMPNEQLQDKVEGLYRDNCKLKEDNKILRKELSESLKATLLFQEKVLQLQERILNYYGIEEKTYLKVIK